MKHTDSSHNAKSHHRRLLTLIVALPLLALPLACGGNGLPQIKGGRDPVLPPGPQRQAQALSSPESTNSADGANADAFCPDGETIEESYDPETGAFSNTFQCTPGGGIASIQNVGQTSPVTGDGAYDQITTFEDGSQNVWHFTIDVSDDFMVQAYHGESADGSESYDGSYTYRADGDYDINDVWNMAEGIYTLVGVTSADGLENDIHQTFDDPNTELSPDYEVDYIQNADGSFSQAVHLPGAESVTDYVWAQDAAGNAEYSFATDMLDTDVEPDFEGSYAYNPDFSGEGSYVQNFDDGSLLNVHDIINLDGSVIESWTFDDASTDLEVDQEGSITYNADGTADGSFTLHSEGGASQTCNIHIDADGVQTVDGCDL